MTEAAVADPLRSFSQTAHAFAGLVRSIPDDRWTGPGLGEWDLRALVGHTSRSLITVETYLNQPAETEDVPTPEAYYLGIANVDAAAVAERGRAAGVALGADPVGFIDALVARVLPASDRPDNPLITTVAGGMRLTNYLPTRTLELVVHSSDIAAAIGQPAPEFGEQVLTEVIGLAAAAAVLQGRGPELLLALTGRSPLPADFSVV
jgi:uncharacterized protein (TIGR03083 family)